MHTLTVAVSAVSGLALGYATAAHFAARTRSALQNRLSDEAHALDLLRKELEKEKSSKPAAAQSQGGKKPKGDSESKKLGKLEKQASEANREVERLKDAQMAESKAHSSALAKVQRQLEEAEQAAATAATEQARSGPGEEAATVSLDFERSLRAAGTSLEAILSTLIDSEEQKGVVLGDFNGIVIAQAGDSETLDNVAAASNTLLSVPHKLKGVLTMSKHFGVQVRDSENSICGHTFELEGDVVALTTVGPRPPNPVVVAAVVESLVTALA